MKLFFLITVVAAIVVTCVGHTAYGQGYGSDSQNVLTPGAGGMAGVSIAQPQDVPAAVFGNPSTLAQFRGTQFTLGGRLGRRLSHRHLHASTRQRLQRHVPHSRICRT